MIDYKRYISEVDMTDDYKTSAFNQAQLQIQRLDNTWNKCIRNREKNDLAMYRRNLLSAEIELLYDAKKIDNWQDPIPWWRANINKMQLEAHSILKIESVLRLLRFNIKVKEIKI